MNNRFFSRNRRIPNPKRKYEISARSTRRSRTGVFWGLFWSPWLLWWGLADFGSFSCWSVPIFFSWFPAGSGVFLNAFFADSVTGNNIAADNSRAGIGTRVFFVQSQSKNKTKACMGFGVRSIWCPLCGVGNSRKYTDIKNVNRKTT